MARAKTEFKPRYKPVNTQAYTRFPYMVISCAAVPGSFLRVPGSNAQSYFAALLLEIALPNSSHV